MKKSYQQIVIINVRLSTHIKFWPTIFLLENHICSCSHRKSHIYATYIHNIFVWKLEYWRSTLSVPLCLLCQLTELCHTFLSLILSSSIPRIVMVYDILALEFEFCSCTPLLDVQTCYLHNILHVSYSSYSSQWLCDQTYCNKNNIP